MKNKLIIIILVSFICILPAFADYNMTTPVDGDTIADETLQFNLIKQLYQIISKENPICSNFSVINTQLIHKPYNVQKHKNKYISGYWKELWTINACGKKRQVPVTFYLHRNGATFYIEKSSIN